MSFLIEAFVRTPAVEPYYKVAYIDECDDIDYHNKSLVALGFSVSSVKARPIDEVQMKEFYSDLHGNMEGVVTNVIEDRPSQPNEE